MPAGVFVTEVVKGCAAEESGQIRPHDRIVAVNDTPIVGLANEEYVSSLLCVVECVCGGVILNVLCWLMWYCLECNVAGLMWWCVGVCCFQRC